MNKYSTLKKLVISCVFFTLTSCGGEQSSSPMGASNTQSYSWKLITSWPKNLPALGTNPERFANLVREMSGGRLDIRVYGANELVGGLEVL